MSYDFPNVPVTNQVVTGSTGVSYRWDGGKWVATGGSGGVTSFNTRTGAVTLSSTDVTTALTYTPYNATNPSGYQTAAQVTTAVATAQTNVGRNLIHNAGFTIAQRGAGPWTTSVYTVDRWSIAFASDAFSFSQSVIGDVSRAQIGDEAAQWQLANTFTGNAAAGAYHYISQKVENVRRLAGKTVTVSFYGLAGSAIKLGVNFYQSFGTGGSPSTLVAAPGQSITFAGGWARYSLTFTLPSVDGKTLGTNNDSSTWLNFWYSCGTTNAALSGNIGVQSGTIQLWGVQLEIGSVATPLEKRDPEQELRQCQRMFSAFAVLVPAAAAPSNLVFPTTMRAAPAVAGGGAGFATSNLSATAVTVSQTAAAAQTLTFSADL